LNGTIEIQSEPTAGTTIHVCVPLRQVELSQNHVA
jgi:chemotaxis protein histidine kinase CheA